MFGGNIPFGLFVLEQEGLLNSREGKINAAIKDFQELKKYNSLTNASIESILNKYGLSENDLTQYEINKIQQEVIGRY